MTTTFGVHRGLNRLGGDGAIAPRIVPATLGHSLDQLGGNFAAQWRSLQHEPQPEMFGEGLLQLAASLETANHPVLALQIYSNLAGAEALPADLTTRARSRLEAYRGNGAGAAEVALRGLAREAIQPGSLLAMTGAGAIFRVTRCASLAHWIPETWGATARLRAAGALAFGAEALSFPLINRAAGSLLGAPETGSGNWARDIGSSFAFLGALRLSGALGRAVSPGRNAGLATVLQQSSLFGGIYLSQHLESALGLKEPGTASAWHSLAMLVQFNVAGRLQHQLLGSSLARWEADLESRSQALAETPRSSRFDWSRLNALNPATVAVSGRRPALNGIDSLVVMMSGSEGEGGGGTGAGGGGGGRGRGKMRREPTLPFIVSPVKRAEAGGQAAEEVFSLQQLLRRIADPDLKFTEALTRDHITFRMSEPLPADEAELGRQLGNILKHLNGLLTTQKDFTPTLGRRIVLVDVNGRRVYLTKTLSNGFQLVHAGETRTGDYTVVEGVRTEEPATEIARRILSPKPPGPDSDPSQLRASVPLVTDSVARLPLLIRSALLHKAPIYTLILQGSTPPLDQLADVLRDIAPSLPAGTGFRLLTPGTRQSFSGEARDGTVVWRMESDPSWERIESQKVFQEVLARNAAEVYQFIEAFRRDANRNPESPATIKLHGESLPRELLAPFVLNALNDLQPRAGRMTLSSTGEIAPLVFSRNHQLWSLDEPEAAQVESKPPEKITAPPASAPEPRSNPPAEVNRESVPGEHDAAYYFSKARELLARRHSMLPTDIAAVMVDPMLASDRDSNWKVVSTTIDLLDLLLAPIPSGLREQTIHVRARQTLGPEGYARILEHCRAKFPAGRTAYIYEDASQKVFELSHDADGKLNIFEVDMDLE